MSKNRNISSVIVGILLCNQPKVYRLSYLKCCSHTYNVHTMYIQHQRMSTLTSSSSAIFCNCWVCSGITDFASGHNTAKDSFEIFTKPAIHHIETAPDSFCLQPCFTGRESQPVISSSSNAHGIH